jgi:DNA invertase Pin-like site-specific DNA recombinase
MKYQAIPAGQGRVWGYCRVSTIAQADDGESLDVQRRQISGYATMQGLTVTRTFTERGVSGAKPLADRPQGSALLAELRPGDIVITAKLDRMFRSALDALAVLSDLQRRGVSLHMIDLGGDTTGNGVSRLVFTILSAVAEAEREHGRGSPRSSGTRSNEVGISAARRRGDTRSRTAHWCRCLKTRRPSPGCSGYAPRASAYGRSVTVCARAASSSRMPG